MNELYKRHWWERGRGLDLWSVPHFLFGALMAALPGLVGISAPTAVALLVIGALLWELYEKFVGIKEGPQNILFDVVLPLVAFTLATFGIDALRLSFDALALLTAVVFAVFMVFNILGWLAHHKRKREEEAGRPST